MLVRRLQRGQHAFAQRLDEIRELTAAVEAFRSDLGALHEQLGAARISAGELEHGLSQRLDKLDRLPDFDYERVALERRIRSLDTLADRLERLAGQAPPSLVLPGELHSILARLSDLTTRMESTEHTERSTQGQEELARLYERIQELAEELAEGRSTSESGTRREAAALQAMSERLERLGTAVETLRRDHADRPEQDEALERLDGLSERLERLGTAVETLRADPSERSEQEETLARLEGVSERLEQLGTAVETLRADRSDRSEYGEIQARLEGLYERLEQLGTVVETLPHDRSDRSEQEEALARLEVLAERLERVDSPAPEPTVQPELVALFERFEALAERIEHAPVALPELPEDAVDLNSASTQELEELRMSLACEEESRRRAEADHDALREKLRASELARVELETRHSTEMAQVVDHVGRQLRKVEDDLKKKKRGLAELTQQNIALQTRLAHVQAELEEVSAEVDDEPPAALPSGEYVADEDAEAEASSDEASQPTYRKRRKKR